jgi:hypothetical protein
VFDRPVTAASSVGDLVVLDAGEGEAAYAAANQTIVREAQALARTRGAVQRLVAVVVWEGAARIGSDATESFRELVAKAGFGERFVSTL